MAMTRLRLRMLEYGSPDYMIAAELEVSPPRLSEYALGKRPIPSRRLYRFCQVFKCDIDELIGYVDETEVPVVG